VTASERPPATSGKLSLLLLPLAAALVVKLLRATMRLRYSGAEELRRWEREGRHFILAFWHRHLALMPYVYRGSGVYVLTSHSRDGELMARTLERFGVGTVRGSSSRGGAMGLRSLLQLAANGADIAFTPDGPRGPAGEIKPGILQAAAMSGLPVVPVAYAATRSRRLRTWDRMEIPLPFSRLEYVVGDPMTVERHAEFEPAAAELKRRLDAVAREAERRAGREAANA
jgi:lysophospholipid acyltransferase (LPLAT)-like uncharacterized protein